MQPFNATLLKGRTALITGGGTGLGLAMAKRFVELGARVVICGRRQPTLEAAAEQLRAVGNGGGVDVQVCDIRDPRAIAEMADRIWEQFSPDILVNNAAGNFIAQTHKLSPAAADAVLAVSMHGALYCTLEFGRRWIDAGRSGVVLSILSTSTITGRAFTVPSAMAKAGVLAMTRSLAVEWGAKNIRLMAIAPGSFPTPGADAQLNPAARQRSASQGPNAIPLGRVGDHEELANLASYVVSDAAAYMTGEMIVLDGGYHLRSSGAEDLLGWTDEQWEAHRASVRASRSSA